MDIDSKTCFICKTLIRNGINSNWVNKELYVVWLLYCLIIDRENLHDLFVYITIYIVVILYEQEVEMGAGVKHEEPYRDKDMHKYTKAKKINNTLHYT